MVEMFNKLILKWDFLFWKMYLENVAINIFLNGIMLEIFFVKGEIS